MEMQDRQLLLILMPAMKLIIFMAVRKVSPTDMIMHKVQHLNSKFH